MKKGFKDIFLKKNGRGFVPYDYSSSYSREDTISTLLSRAVAARAETEEYWKKMRSYYDGTHGTALFTEGFAAENSLPFRCAQSADGYIHVESQIDAVMPDFEFSPMGEDDGDKAKQREKIVRYICERNDMEYKNSRNERRLGILGSAVWKVCWDDGIQHDGNIGDIVIDYPHPKEIFPDPVATCVDDCEYIGYVYSMHREKARRIFARDLEMRNIDFDELVHRSGSGKNAYGDIFDSDTLGDTVKITEWWFRHPTDGEADVEYITADGKRASFRCRYSSGDIGLCILLGDMEVRYVPRYWNETGCRMFPFVIYDKLPNENTIWGKSEIEAIIPFIDAADREIAYAQLNSAFSSNDIIVAEENAFSDDCEPDNSPGAVWKLRPGMMGKVQRLGNSAFAESYLHANYDKWKNLMQEITGNFTVNQGNEPEKVTTATGIALLNERAKNRNALKKIDKCAGFKRLFELCDRTALEYYDDGRVILCGAAKDGGVVYKSSDYRKKNGDESYIPSVDIRIHIGDGLSHSKAFTVSAVSSLMTMPINESNYRIVKSYLELIELPARQEICEALDEMYGKSNGDEAMLSEILDIALKDKKAKDNEKTTGTEAENE